MATISEFRQIHEIPEPYRQIFQEYPCFNTVQSRVMDDILYTDESLVLAAPTGSGKTVIFELAIIRLLQQYSTTPYNFKIIYIAPMKALCEERLIDWHKKFLQFNLNCIAVTGDYDYLDMNSLHNHQLIVTTPEKWDSLTRKWRDHHNLVQIIRLFMLDEIHLIAEERRGATLEAIVCRMKTIGNENGARARFVAVSATAPNPDDLALWLHPQARCHQFTDAVRPVRLETLVLGYSYDSRTCTPFKFDISLNYRLQPLIMKYSHGRPVLVFCSTRKSVEMTARYLLQNLRIDLTPERKSRLNEAGTGLKDSRLVDYVGHGIAYHHAGLLVETRRTIEDLFRTGLLPILVTTSTLAMGVNLPAHLVIIKSTKCYLDGGFRDYTETTLLQMIGRAGRPQYDTTATAIIMTAAKDKVKFEAMIGGGVALESNLHRNLVEHLNAEVVSGTIDDLDVAMRWLSETFLRIRARKNPGFYGLPVGLTTDQTDKKLLDICQIDINKLVKGGMLTMDYNINIRPTFLGELMAKYYISFPTMKLFAELNGEEILQQLLGLISRCHEFSENYLRVDDKRYLNILNNKKSQESIRFPLNGKIKTLDMKINCLIQAVMGCLDINDHSLLSEARRIMPNGKRITKCLIEYLENRLKSFKALLNAIILSKCFETEIWENSPFLTKQLQGIGNVMSKQLVASDKTTFNQILESDPREIELIINKKAPIGNKIINQIQHLPKYQLEIKQIDKNIQIIIKLINYLLLQQESTVDLNSMMYLLVGNEHNYVLIYKKFKHSYFLTKNEITETIKIDANNQIFAHLISNNWVGFDCCEEFHMKTDENTVKPKQNKPIYMEKFMDIYLKQKNKKTTCTITKSTVENTDLMSTLTQNGPHTDNAIYDVQTEKDDIEKEIYDKYKNEKVKINDNLSSYKVVEILEPKTIKWRSPLESRYSPIISDQCSTPISIEEPTTSTNQMTDKQPNTTNQWSNSMELNSTKDITQFPLADNDYQNSPTLGELKIICSDSFLQDLGLVENIPPSTPYQPLLMQQTTSTTNTNLTNANDYYEHIVGRTDTRMYRMQNDVIRNTANNIRPFARNPQRFEFHAPQPGPSTFTFRQPFEFSQHTTPSATQHSAAIFKRRANPTIMDDPYNTIRTKRLCTPRIRFIPPVNLLPSPYSGCLNGPELYENCTCRTPHLYPYHESYHQPYPLQPPYTRLGYLTVQQYQEKLQFIHKYLNSLESTSSANQSN